ncbi:hypothetical protein A7K69_18610 [Parageobacillus thermoglucosidasius]|uniref:Uncharacterized protein n=1 Tax=Parageobacillus thermoglucosidasius TaxID=1426 RepID=A0A1B7KUD1_PARTM|nr:hypothetical protein A7K69_18610 [Parageobacillus thermoglucosidasius]
MKGEKQWRYLSADIWFILMIQAHITRITCILLLGMEGLSMFTNFLGLLLMTWAIAINMLA